MNNETTDTVLTVNDNETTNALNETNAFMNNNNANESCKEQQQDQKSENG